MKERPRIMSLLSSRRPATGKDKLSIVAWCEKRKMKVHFPGVRDAGYGSLETITLDQFTAWYRARHYDPGEVVTAGDGTVYLITGFIGGECASGAYITPAGEFSAVPVVVHRDPTHRKSSVPEKAELQRAMNRAKLTWNPYKKCLAPYALSGKNYYVTVWVIGDMVGMGIYKEIDADGNLVMYCCTDGKGSLEFDNNYVFGPVADYAVREARTTERSGIIEELNRVQLYWHGRLKRFEPLDLRKPAGNKYYYIDAGGRINAAVENGRNVDDKRFNFGNYFHSHEEADSFKRHITIERSEQLIGKLEIE